MKLSRRNVLAGVAVVAVVVGAADLLQDKWKWAPSGPRSVFPGDAPLVQQRPATVKEFLTGAGWAAVTAPTKVEVFDLTPDVGGETAKDIAAYFNPHNQFTAMPIKVAPELIIEFQKVLTTDALYSLEHGSGGKCGGYRPHEAIRFWRGNDSIAFLVCFTCNDIGVVVHDAYGRVVHFQRSKGATRGSLLSAFKRALPGDRYLDGFYVRPDAP